MIFIYLNREQADRVRGFVDEHNFCDPIETEDGRYLCAPEHEDYINSKIGKDFTKKTFEERERKVFREFETVEERPIEIKKGFFARVWDSIKNFFA